MKISKLSALVGLAALVGGCGGGPAHDAGRPGAEEPGGASVYWDGSRPTAEELAQGRMDMSWRRVVRVDTVGDENDIGNPEEWEGISPQAVNTGPMHLPLHGDVSGPSVLRTQVLLSRAFFSPGILDGRWGSNTEKAIYWFQEREGLPATGRLDEPTFTRLVEVAGSPMELVRTHRLSEQEVAGPFVSMPDDVYERAELECSCYESLREKLSERFHASVDLLEQLNPGVDLNSVSAGSTLQVPNVRSQQAAYGARVASIVVSDAGRYVHALDENGRILFHFPATLGSQYDPSPEGDYRVTKITEDPWWHYQPSILSYADDDDPEARIPPGPNNAVGVVWMALSKPHYGIHGTNSPETIGYATSAGCVRLTNWDAIFLATRTPEGTPVSFRDT
jgi:lipoprotein-anchoring transpeptidase ErfK/SrfK